MSGWIEVMKSSATSLKSAVKSPSRLLRGDAGIGVALVAMLFQVMTVSFITIPMLCSPSREMTSMEWQEVIWNLRLYSIPQR